MNRHEQQNKGDFHPARGITILLWTLSLAVFSGVEGSQVEPASARVVEITADTIDLLPAGKEADGIVGDFVLANERIHALISANLPARKANYGTQRGYITPGCLYDLDFVGAANDQLTILRPGGLGGRVSYVRIIAGRNQRAAVVEVVRTAAAGNQVIDEFLREIRLEVQAKRMVPQASVVDDAALLHMDPRQLTKPFREKLQYLQTVPRNLYARHEYRLEPGWQHLLITSTYRNEGTTAIRFPAGPNWNEFSAPWRVGAIHLGDSVDPQDKRAYGWMPAAIPDPLPIEGEAQLGPNEERSVSLAVAVGESPLAALGVLQDLAGKTGTVRGLARDTAGQPVTRGRVLVQSGGLTIPAYLDSQGAFSFRIPPGNYSAKLEDLGRTTEQKTFSVSAGGETPLEFTSAPTAGVRLEIRDFSGQPVPAKVQFIPERGAPSLNLGPDIRARGCKNQYFSPDGSFTQQLPPGNYLLRITRGPEFDMVDREVCVQPGQTTALSVVLSRSVDTRGWISSDYHSHTTESGDSQTGIADRLINLAAEQIEFAPSTEHNRISDWRPQVLSLGLQRCLKTIPGLELTRSEETHLNAFPLEIAPRLQDGGAPPWPPPGPADPRIKAITLRALPGPGQSRWVQLNHPSIGQQFNDLDKDHLADGGYTPGFELLVDGTEASGTEILNLSPTYEQRAGVAAENRTFGWLQLLNQGRRLWNIAVSDEHRVCGGVCGAWRTYVQSSQDQPAAIDVAEIIANSKAGRMMVTNGPFLEVTADGLPIGSTVSSKGPIELKIRVQCSNWIDIDRVQVLVNGRQESKFNFTRHTHLKMFQNGVIKFDQAIPIHLKEDAHLIVVAVGENLSLSKGWATGRSASMTPLAFTNPIFVDLNGDGFRANGDTLGHPLLVAPNFPEQNP